MIHVEVLLIYRLYFFLLADAGSVWEDKSIYRELLEIPEFSSDAEMTRVLDASTSCFDSLLER
jgi:hypothetical protein